MLAISEVKTWLRLEQEESHEDGLLQSLIQAAEKKLENAVTAGTVPEDDALARLYQLCWIHDWYNRVNEMAETRRSLICQLQNAYPLEEEAGEGD